MSKIVYYYELDDCIRCLLSEWKWQVREALSWLRYYWHHCYLLRDQENEAIRGLSQLVATSEDRTIRREAAKLLWTIFAES